MEYCDVILLMTHSSRIRVPNKTKDVNLHSINLIKRTIELQTLLKHVSFEYNCKFDTRKRISN